jgi:hypothetical protein
MGLNGERSQDENTGKRFKIPVGLDCVSIGCLACFCECINYVNKYELSKEAF